MSDMHNCPTCGTLVPNYLPVTRQRQIGEFVAWTWPEWTVIQGCDISGTRANGRYVDERGGRARVKTAGGDFLVPFSDADPVIQQQDIVVGPSGHPIGFANCHATPRRPQ